MGSSNWYPKPKSRHHALVIQRKKPRAESHVPLAQHLGRGELGCVAHQVANNLAQTEQVAG